MKIWLDDVRPMPDGYDYWAKNARECIEEVLLGNVSFISFDHDLGQGKSGYDVAKIIEEMAYCGFGEVIKYNIHSANPVGRRNIEMAMNSAQRFWNKEN